MKVTPGSHFPAGAQFLYHQNVGLRPVTDHAFTQQTAKSGCWEAYAQGPATEA